MNFFPVVNSLFKKLTFHMVDFVITERENNILTNHYFP